MWLSRGVWTSLPAAELWGLFRVLETNTLQWRHNGRDDVPNHKPHDCLFNRLYRRISKKNFKTPRHWPLCGNSPVTCEFPVEMTSNAEIVSIGWRHYELEGMLVGIVEMELDLVE